MGSPDQDDRYTRIVRVAASGLGVPIVVLSATGADGERIRASIGIQADDLPPSLLAGLLESGTDRGPGVRADDGLSSKHSDDPRGLRFGVGRPLLGPDGERIGLLCALDRRQRDMSEDERERLTDFARIAETQLALDAHLALDAPHGLIRAVSTGSEPAVQPPQLQGGQASESELLLIATDEGICGVDASGQITFANPAARRMLEPLHPVLGRSLVSYLTPVVRDLQEPGAEPAIALTLADGVTRRFEQALPRTDGSTFAAEIVVAATTHGGQRQGAVVVIRDVSIRSEVDRIKDEIVSVAGHEMRTPLTAILGSLGLLAGGAISGLDPRAQRMLEIAVSNADRLLRLIDDILDLERIEAGRIGLRREPQLALDLLETVARVVSSLAAEAGVELFVEADSIAVAADGDRMVQALTNLAANAIKFSPIGARVELRARRSGDNARFEVRDRGRGIAPERIRDVFERFEQVDASDAREKGGTGLGLAIARRIVDEHGGRIWAESSVNQGSTFVIELPALDIAWDTP